jgi:hypothetical protein
MFIMYHGQHAEHIHIYSVYRDSEMVVHSQPNLHCAQPLDLELDVGCVYQVTGSLTDGFTPGTEQYVFTAPTAAALRLQHAAQVAQTKRADWCNELTQVREAYRTARGQQRDVILAMVIAEVTRG